MLTIACGILGTTHQCCAHKVYDTRQTLRLVPRRDRARKSTNIRIILNVYICVVYTLSIHIRPVCHLVAERNMSPIEEGPRVLVRFMQNEYHPLSSATLVSQVPTCRNVAFLENVVHSF